MNKTVAVAIALAGLALGTGVVIWLGARHVLDTVLQIGWLSLVYVVSWQLAVYVLLGVAWWVLCPSVNLWVVIWARLVREGGQTCLPFSEIGGLVFGARALMLGGCDFARSAASTIADVIAEGIGLIPFLLFGLIAVLTHRPGTSVLLSMGIGFGVLVLGGIAAFLCRRQFARLLRAGTARLLKPWVKDAPKRADELQQSVENLLHQYGRVTASSLLHLLCWCGGGGNIWLIYHLLGASASVADALAIESMLSSVLSVGLLVPASLGVQELSYVGIGGLFAIPGHFSLALSLIRRARDIIIGAPALLLWQALEARELRKRHIQAPPS
jgi:glycosyltransferase 2 family protein